MSFKHEKNEVPQIRQWTAKTFMRKKLWFREIHSQSQMWSWSKRFTHIFSRGDEKFLFVFLSEVWHTSHKTALLQYSSTVVRTPQPHMCNPPLESAGHVYAWPACHALCADFWSPSSCDALPQQFLQSPCFPECCCSSGWPQRRRKWTWKNKQTNKQTNKSFSKNTTENQILIQNKCWKKSLPQATSIQQWWWRYLICFSLTAWSANSFFFCTNQNAQNISVWQ